MIVAERAPTSRCPRAERGVREQAALELTFIVGYQTFASKFAKAFQLAPQGFSA